MNMKTVRNTREPLKKPRPLKSVSSNDSIKCNIQDPKETVAVKSLKETLTDLETLNVSISNITFDDVTLTDISRMCAILKKRGEELDKSDNKEAIDRIFCTLRNASRDERLDMVSRLKLLEIIEIRANKWRRNDNIQNYFNSKILELEGVQDLSLSSSSSMTSIPYILQNQNLPVMNPIPLAPGEILRSSGKFAKPTKIAGKNTYKDEILIRNSDSGKVNPGARDRLVQITGPHEDAIGHAKKLVEDTIRRNVSPVREKSDISLLDNAKESVDYNNVYPPVDNQTFLKRNLQHSYSLSDATGRGEHSIDLKINEDLIRLSGKNPELLKIAYDALKDCFSRQADINKKQHEQFSLNRQSSSDRIKPRNDLRRQSSLKSNMETLYSPSFLLNHANRESTSPLSSSDDSDFIREDKRNDKEQEPNYLLDRSNSIDVKLRRTTTFDPPSFHGELMRKSSVPNDFGRNGFPEINSPTHNEVFSPVMSSLNSEILPIPPPTYKMRRYSRDSLLNLANSPFSHNQPADYAHIHQTCQDIICESPIMFDPQKFKERENKSDETVSRLK